MKRKSKLNKNILLIIFFILGFAISALIFYTPSVSFPSTQVSDKGIEIIPIVDRNYFDIVVTEIQNAQRNIDMAVFQFRFYENEKNKVETTK